MTSPSENPTETRALPEWAAHALNGGSTRVSRPWEFSPADRLACEVVEMREARHTTETEPYKVLTLRVEAGTEQGQPVEAGEWLTLSCQPATLRKFVSRDNPQPGDRMAVLYRGKTRGKLDFVSGVYRDDQVWS
jgi:hypothetical protein